MKILIDGKDYEFIYGYEPTIKEIVDEKLENLKKINKYLFYTLKKISENTNFTIIADRRYLYFLTLNEVEKKFIKEYHNNVNYFNEIDLQLKLKNSNVLYFKIIDENDKYEKYLTEYYEFNEKEKKNKGFKWYLINIKNINKKDIKKEVVIFFQKLKRLDFKENEIDLYKADDFFIFQDEFNILETRNIILEKNFTERKITKELKLKTLTNYNSDDLYYCFWLYYLESLSANFPFLKDIYNDFLNKNNYCLDVAINFNLLSLAKNKRHLLELYLSSLKRKKYKLYKSFNRKSLNESYSIIKAEKYINNNEISIFLSKDIGMDKISDENLRVETYLCKHLSENLTGILKEKEDKDIKMYIKDYIKMLVGLRGKIKYDPNIRSFNKLKRVHLNIAIIYAEIKCKDLEVTLNKKNPFLKLKLPKDIKRLETKEDFFMEGKTNQNCVFMYITSVNNGECIIYTYLHNNKRYTIEIRYHKKLGYYLNQIKGYFNSNDIPKEVLKYIKNSIKAENKRLNYIK